MKIEKINENQIRAILSSEDLHARNLNIKELAYGSPGARKLFTDLMKKAREEVGFDTENLPLMIEAIPLPDDCLVMVVTKVAEPEELDTRFSRFSSSPEEVAEKSGDRYKDLDSIMDNLEDIMAGGFGSSKAGHAGTGSGGTGSDNVWKIKDEDSYDELYSDDPEKAFDHLSDDPSETDEEVYEGEFDFEAEEDLTNPFLEDDQDLPFPSDPEDDLPMHEEVREKEIPLHDLMSFLKAEIQARKKADRKGTGQDRPVSNRKRETALYSFASLDQVIAYANFVSPFYCGDSYLYKTSDGDRYLLLLTEDGIADPNLFYRACNIAADFSVKMPVHYGTPAYLKEHCALLLPDQALEKLKGF